MGTLKWILAIILLSSSSLAARPGLTRYQALEQIVDRYRLSCATYAQEEICQNSFSQKVLFKLMPVKPLSLDKATHGQLERIAFEQAQIWGDTILEGDFVAAGDTRLERVVGIYREHSLVAYLISYSETAWSTADCAIEDENPESLKGCVQGVIRESAFVSPTLQTVLTDDEHYAEFE